LPVTSISKWRRDRSIPHGSGVSSGTLIRLKASSSSLTL
jgi:hypothetical protein